MTSSVPPTRRRDRVAEPPISPSRGAGIGIRAAWIAWTLAVAAACVGLVTPMDPDTLPDRLVLGAVSDGALPWTERLGSALFLTHLSLQRAYPWLFLAPYLVWLSLRVPIDTERAASRWILHLGAVTACVAASQALLRYAAAAQPTRIVYAVVESRSTTSPEGGSVTRTHRIRRPLPASAGTILDRWFTNDFDAVAGRDPGSKAGSAIPGPFEVRYRLVDVETTNGPVPFPLLDSPGFPGSTSTGTVDVRIDRSTESSMPPIRRGGARLASVLLDGFAFASVIGISHAAHFFRRYRERERRAILLESRLTRSRLETLQAQLQPHFLFNALNSIAALLREDPRAAEEMLVAFGDLLRRALDQSSRHEHALHEELEFTRRYLAIQQVRFGDRLKYDIEVEPGAQSACVPSLLLQPLVENAVRHGIEPSDRPGTIRIVARCRGEDLVLEIDDDGVGTAHASGEPIRFGIGLTNVQERLDSLYGRAATLSVRERHPSGFGAVVTLPRRTESS